MKANRPKYYNINIVEQDGVLNLVDATTLQPINQFRNVMKRVSVREFAKKMRNSKLVTR